MFLKRRKNQDGSKEEDWHLSKGGLDPAHVRLGPALHHGIPKTSSKLAFDPDQRLLAIGTLDGRIKLVGGNGVEGMLVSTSQSRCKFLEFANNQGLLINITAENELQIWNLEKRILAQTHRWHTNVTAFAVIQGSPFMYIGEDSGDIAVLQYDKEEERFRQMPYYIPVHATRGGLAKSCNYPSVVDILPFPETIHSRVLIAYDDGVIIVWGIYDAQVLQMKGTRATVEHHFNDVEVRTDGDDEEEKDISCVCWADPNGGLLGVGYTDGDIWLWDLASMSTSQSNASYAKLQLSSDKSRSPVLALRWCAAKATGGHLFVYGGGSFGCSEDLTICSLRTVNGQLDMQKVCHVDLPLEGLFEDMILLPGPGGTFTDQTSALLVLTSQGQLHAYDQADITKCFKEVEARSGPSLPEPVSINPFTSEPSITVTKVVQLYEDGKTSNVLSQLPRHFRGNLPSVLPGGTKWPVTGGTFDKSPLEGTKVEAVLVTGHSDGSVNVWDASTSVFFHLSNLSGSAYAISTSAVSHIEFCPGNGLLVVAQASGVVFVHRLSVIPSKARCVFIKDSEIQDQEVLHGAGFQCVAVLNFGVAAVSSISIADQFGLVAVGYIDGMVLVFDIESCCFMSHYVGSSSGQSQVKFLTFGPRIKMSWVESSTVPDSPLKGVIYAVTGDSSITAMLYENGKAVTCGPWHIDGASKVLHFFCLEYFNEKEDDKPHSLDKQLSVKMEDEADCSGKDFQAAGLSCYIILCTQTSAYLYSSFVSNETVSLTGLKTAQFSASCSYASSIVSQDTNAHGLVLLDNTASLEIWSLPDLDIVKRVSLAGICNLDPKLSENPTFVSGNKGLSAVVDVRRELIMFSFLSMNEKLRTGEMAVSFFNKDVAAAGEAALKAGVQPAARRKSQLQGLIGGVIKEIKGGFSKSPKSGKDEPTGMSEPDNLSRLFASPLNTQTSASLQPDKISQHDTTTSAVELEIDDIVIDDEDISSEPGSIDKLATSLKGKEKVTDPADERKQLFDGDEGFAKPVRRSPDEIRAKYGHKPLGDVSGAAGLARDKLLERQEKLQALGKRSEEMREGAENFASMAKELAKTMEARKWWQI